MGLCFRDVCPKKPSSNSKETLDLIVFKETMMPVIMTLAESSCRPMLCGETKN